MINTICLLCKRAIDLHHVIRITTDGNAEHLQCFLFQQYAGLTQIGWGLVNAIEQGEEIDVDRLREDLLTALEGIE